MMKWKEILAEIFKSLSVIPDIKWDERDILRRANIAQDEIVRNTGCTIKINSDTTSTTGVSEYNKPDDCIRILRVTYASKRLYGVTKSQLDIAASQGAIDSPWTDNSDTPTHYYDEDLIKIGCYPKPDTTGDTITFEYVYLPLDLELNDEDIPFDDIKQLYDYHNLFCAYVLWQCFLETGKEGFLPMAMMHEKIYKDGVVNLARQMQNRPDKIQTFDLIRSRTGKRKLPLTCLE